MNSAAVNRLDRITNLLDRARLAASADAAEVEALLDEALQTIADSEHARSAGLAPDPALDRAVGRVRASHAALLDVLRTELARLGRQLSAVTAGRDASVRYAAPRAPARAGRLDRVG